MLAEPLLGITKDVDPDNLKFFFHEVRRLTGGPVEPPAESTPNGTKSEL